MNKKEVEIRFPVSVKDYSRIESFIKKNSQRIELFDQKDIYFCHNSYIKTNSTAKTPYIIRIRETKKTKELAYKAFHKKGSWVEIETKIEDIKTMGTILKHIQHSSFLTINKKRVSAKIGLLEINLDNIKNLGLFVELEKKGESYEKEKGILIKFAEDKLNIKKVDILHQGYVQLMEEKLKNQNKKNNLFGKV